eukprot:CAMPEP_0204123124 /NCGR_PEP_ID=MMETSP0361-20130328/9106_1 /ASSEMBLY_ACC=CAM_ASM_000343 /TAXON_ID=268821 /ORGANISM="Scrippsiella Hangoei, Strain SHTV-5" /LENGTH=52 /DNA_ID=CAMNT_0051074523 /DNA_START=1 /DNA_END=155 /DNA_ORIENTATION=-
MWHCRRARHLRATEAKECGIAGQRHRAKCQSLRLGCCAQGPYAEMATGVRTA